MSRNRQTLAILLLTAGLAALSVGLLHTRFWRAELAETNFQSNLIRLQSFFFGAQPKAVLVGSSFSGRLLPSYFEGTQIAPLANLGLDGSSALMGLEFCAERPPGLVLVEANTMLVGYNKNEHSLTETVRSFGFRLSKYVPVLRARGRPSSVLYSWMKARGPRAQGLTRQFAEASQEEQNQQAGKQSSNEPSAAALAETKNAVRRRIAEVQRLGCKIVLVRLPCGGRFPKTHPTMVFADELAREFKLPQIDLEQECSSRGCHLAYTDGLHLAPLSAREASKVLAELASQAGQSPLATARNHAE